jgi:ubiquinone/menaquinone biosynthesis C-methylase UbiE
MNHIKLGDFTGLAESYSKYRPGYSDNVLEEIVSIINKPISEVDFVDIGAGTGIWTRMVHKLGPKSTLALEPNLDMFSKGVNDSKLLDIKWVNATAEETNLLDNSVDWITMASSFHWTDFDRALKEFNRILRKDGALTLLWNPRYIFDNELLVEIEDYLFKLSPGLIRKSSGLSGVTDGLSERLMNTGFFKDVIQIEKKHTHKFSRERYIGIWESVNDLKAQLGVDKFNKFLEFVVDKTKNLEEIEVSYITRSWTALKLNRNKN